MQRARHAKIALKCAWDRGPCNLDMILTGTITAFETRTNNEPRFTDGILGQGEGTGVWNDVGIAKLIDA